MLKTNVYPSVLPIEKDAIISPTKILKHFWIELNDL